MTISMADFCFGSGGMKRTARHRGGSGCLAWIIRNFGIWKGDWKKVEQSKGIRAYESKERQSNTKHQVPNTQRRKHKEGGRAIGVWIPNY